MKAFTVLTGVGITYRAGAWHRPMIALDIPASFAIAMWCDEGDDEFVSLSHPVIVNAENRLPCGAFQSDEWQNVAAY